MRENFKSPPSRDRSDLEARPVRANQARVGRSGRTPAALASGHRLGLGKTDRQDFGAVIPALRPPSQGYCRAVARNLNSQSQRWQTDVIMMCQGKINKIKKRTPDLQRKESEWISSSSFLESIPLAGIYEFYSMKYVGFG